MRLRELRNPSRGLVSLRVRSSRSRAWGKVDGDAYHATRLKADAARDRKLVRAGYTVLRIPASVVERELSAAVRLVREAIERRDGHKSQ